MLPIPELYVIYHGGRGDKPDEITLSRDVFGIDDPKNIFVDVKAKIIYDSTPGDIIDQFITFARVFDRQVQEHGRTRKAVEETLQICRNQDVLRDYLVEEEDEPLTTASGGCFVRGEIIRNKRSAQWAVA